jgi:hypothetical protein
MNTASAQRRRIAGWTCIALGKAGSLWLAWIVLTGASGVAPLAVLAAVGTCVVLGLWLLMGIET